MKMIAKFVLKDAKGFPMGDLEFAVSYEHATIEEAWFKGEPLDEEELGRWIRRLGEDTIRRRATKPEANGMRAAKNERERKLENGA